jgi:hypothetical protein
MEKAEEIKLTTEDSEFINNKNVQMEELCREIGILTIHQNVITAELEDVKQQIKDFTIKYFKCKNDLLEFGEKKGLTGKAVKLIKKDGKLISEIHKPEELKEGQNG